MTYEDDEPVESIKAAFAAGDKDVTTCPHTVVSTYEPLPGWETKPVEEWEWRATCFACKADGVVGPDRRFTLQSNLSHLGRQIPSPTKSGPRHRSD